MAELIEVITDVDGETCRMVQKYLTKNFNGLFMGSAWRIVNRAPGKSTLWASALNEHDIPIIRALAIGYAAGYSAGTAGR